MELVAGFYTGSWADVQLMCGSGYHCRGSWQGGPTEGVEEIPAGWVVRGKPWILGMEAPQDARGVCPGVSLQAAASPVPWGGHGLGVGARAG